MNIACNAAVLCFATLAITTAACSSTSSKNKAAKSSSAKTAAAAKTEKEKTGAKAKAAAPNGENKGATFEEVPCDGDTEDVGFCGDDGHVVVCAAGTWYAVGCAQLEFGAFCGEQDDIVDCYTDE